MEQRVTLTEPEDMSSDQQAVYERFQSNLTRALLLTKGSAAPHLALGASFTVGLLSLLDREITVLRVAKLRESAFERAIHYPLGVKAGLTDEEIHAIENGVTETMEPRRAALVNYVTDCILLRKATDASYWGLREHYSQNEIAEITHLLGHADMTALYLEALEIPLDEKFASWGRLTELQSVAAAQTI